MTEEGEEGSIIMYVQLIDHTFVRIHQVCVRLICTSVVPSNFVVIRCMHIQNKHLCNI